MPKTKPQHGGKRRGAGRPAISPGMPTVSYNLRLTEAQRDKLEQLGGAQWLRDRINKARAA